MWHTTEGIACKVLEGRREKKRLAGSLGINGKIILRWVLKR
jgi:hypothetical protein